MMSPRTIPQITARAGRKPEASALATVANTPGPGLAARTNIATESPIIEYSVIIFSKTHRSCITAVELAQAVKSVYGLNGFSFKSFIILKCFALLDTKDILFSTAVAAIIASPDLIPEERVYSSI